MTEAKGAGARCPKEHWGRREFVCSVATAGMALAGCASRAVRPDEPQHGAEAEVTPGEDLMQEHGVLERILLIYDESTRRIEHGAELDLAVVAGAAGIVRRFVEEYHERSEEQYVFPRLQAHPRTAQLVAVLRQQHERGRQLTDEITRLSAGSDRAALAQQLHAFVRMYRPHAAREETVLFPAFRATLGRSGYRELGERFEHEEHARFGEHGFEEVVAQVARLEAALGIADLMLFTPA
jgi:hemerythrin-like domain-containing protein